jgi:predicted amino acid dehydrogenase
VGCQCLADFSGGDFSALLGVEFLVAWRYLVAKQFLRSETAEGLIEEDPMILVLGATGTTGGEIARQLIAEGQRPRLLVRNPERAREFQGKAEIVQGDLERTDSLSAAMKGVEEL